MTPKTSGRSSSGKSSSRSGSTTITILTTLLPSPTNTYEVINDGGPFPTIDQHTPPAPTSSGDVSGGGGDDPPVQPKLLGGIFGGIAGLGIMLYLILLLLKRHKRRQRIQAQEDAGYGGPLEAGGSQSMVQRSMSFLGAAGLVSRYHRTDPEPEPQERGFVRVSGRKLPPVIGGPRPDYGSMRSAGEASSYYRDDDVSLGGVNAPATPVSSIGPGRYSSPPPPGSPSFQPTGTPSRLREGLDSDSGGLATSGSYRSSKTQVRQPLYLRQLAASDGVGRSLASRDGSKASRFTEDVT